MFPQLETALMYWDLNHPSSHQYSDVYYARASGPAESRYVFLDQNQLPERFARLAAEGRSHFTIAETGFGTGLNFLMSWSLWRQHTKSSSAVLHFISMERWPLSREDLTTSLSAWPELHELTAQLLEAYPPSLQGFHRLVLDQGRVRLTLLLGDAVEQLEKAVFQTDAWFLDGFAPAKNPELWTPKLFDLIQQRSTCGTTFATFTAAGVIRRSLQERGFAVEKVPGFGRKREMLRGVCQHEEQPPYGSTLQAHPWLTPPTAPLNQSKQAIVIGAGLAGTNLAWNLHSRGWQVRIYDQEGIASGASGNPQGALYTKLGVEYTPQTRLQISSLLFSQGFYNQLAQSLPEQDFWHPCGVLQLAYNENERERQQKFLARNQYPKEVLYPVSSEKASQLAGTRIDHDGLFFPQSGYVRLAELCHSLLNAAQVTCHSQHIKAISYNTEQQAWLLLGRDDEVLDQAPVVIIATASASLQFTQANQLPLKSIRGQVSLFPQPKALTLNSVVCGEGYVSPPRGGMLCTGATFQHNNESRVLQPADHTSNLNQLARLLPDLAPHLETADSANLDGRVGFRCASSDFLPLVGPLPNQEVAQEAFSKPSEIASNDSDQLYWPGLYISTGHGSKGLATCPLAAELLADLICGQPLCVEADLYRILSPMRFIVRQQPKQ